MNKEFEMVKEFHRTFNHPVAEKPKMLESERVMARSEWLYEEVDEFIASKDMYEQADAMIDLMYFALGCLVEMGIKPDRLFEIVQRANMSKLWSDGLPHYNDLGKVIKPADWKDPYPLLVEEIDRQNAGE